MGDIADLMDGLWLPCESIQLVCDLDSRKVMTVYELNCKGSKWNCIDYPRLTKESSLKLLLTSANLIYSYNRPHRNRLGSKHKLFRSESEQLELEKAVAKALKGSGVFKLANEERERLQDLHHPERKYFPIVPKSATAEALGFSPKGATGQALGIDPRLATTQVQLGNESLVYSKIQNELDGINTHAWQGTANDSGVAKALQEVNPTHKTPLEEALLKATAYDSFYGESARNVLEAFDNGLGSQEIFNTIHDYTTNVDEMLSGGINADIARALIDPHVAVMEKFQYREVPELELELELELEPEKEADEDWKKEAKKLRLEKEADNEEIARLNADNSMVKAEYAKLASQLEVIKSFLGESFVEGAISANDEINYLKKRNKELEPMAKLPEPTAEENEHFNALGARRKSQVIFVGKVVEELKVVKTNNEEKRQVYTKCNLINPSLITGSYGTFQRIWVETKKSGLAPK